MFRVSFPVHVGRMHFMSIQFLSGGRPVVGKFCFFPADDPTRLVISNPSCLLGLLRNFFSILVTGTNCNELGEAGVGWSPTRPTTAYQDFPKNNRHNPVMVYNDLMIRYNTVSYYNTNRSQPVTVQCINT